MADCNIKSYIAPSGVYINAFLIYRRVHIYKNMSNRCMGCGIDNV